MGDVAEIIILGTNLTGTTKVSFNTTAATFTIVSASEITATVPSGATTGSLTVTTPSGTLKSNLVFKVIPQIAKLDESDRLYLSLAYFPC